MPEAGRANVLQRQESWIRMLELRRESILLEKRSLNGQKHRNLSRLELRAKVRLNVLLLVTRLASLILCTKSLAELSLTNSQMFSLIHCFLCKY